MRYTLSLLLALAAPAADLVLPLRTRVETFKGSGVWDEVRVERRLPVQQTGLLICDMWSSILRSTGAPRWCRPT